MADAYGYATLQAVQMKRPQPNVDSIKSELSTVEMVLGTVEKILERNYAIKDPVIRYVILVDKLNMFTDVLSTVCEMRFKSSDHADYISKYKGDDYDENIEKELLEIQREKDQMLAKIRIVSKTFRDEMSRLIDWIQSPKYSPDHPLGEMMLQATMSHFNQGVEKEKIEKEDKGSK